MPKIIYEAPIIMNRIESKNETLKFFYKYRVLCLNNVSLGLEINKVPTKKV